MSKELVISATQHETRVAILEEGQLCEIYVEREKEFALVGSIYKGRVTRVLPGMQSAFVDIGLDSDAFLYVSDFLENLEDYDHIVHSVEEKVQKMEEQGGTVFTPAPVAGPPEAALPPEPAAEAVPSAEPAPAESAPPEPRRDFDRPGGFRNEGRGFGDRGGFGRGRGGRRGRRGRRGDRPDRGDRGPRHGRELPPSKFASPHAPSYEPSAPSEPYEPIILPGESLAKYRDRVPGDAAPPAAPASNFDAATLTEPAANPAEDVSATEPAGLEPAAHPVEAPRDFPAAAEPVQEPEPESSAVASHFAAEPVAEPQPVETRESEEPALLAAIPTIAPPAVEPPSVAHDFSVEEMSEIAEHVAEAEAEIAGESNEAGEEEAEEMEYEDESGERAPGDEGNEIHAAAAGESAAESMDEPGDEPQPGNTWSPADGAHDAAESAPTQARVEDRHRARFQRPMRRGGRGRRGVRRGGGRPDRRPPRQQRALPQIADLLKSSQEIIVQIAKEPLGKKGARITSHVALPGRYLVYMPTVEHIGVSRKIASADRRSRLRHLVTDSKNEHGFPGGFIVRTAAEGASEEEIRSDVQYLGRTWMEILQRGEGRRAPSLLHRDLNLVERILRDHLSSDYTSIWIDNEEEYTRVVEFVSRFQPSLVNRVKLFVKPAPIFEEFGIQQEIDKALRPKVWLKSGGYIVINHTEALVAIDVNTGKFVGRGSNRLEDTIVRTNMDAVKEIVRQIRLRDLGGIIVIDFIDMEERKNRIKVMQALEDALRSDKAPSKVLAFNEFGLVAITRKRTKQALERVLCQPCTYCGGSGMVKSIPTICYEIQTEARKMAGELDSASITLRVHPEIAKALKTRESTLVEELEQWTRKSVIIQADPTLHWEQYDIY